MNTEKTCARCNGDCHAQNIINFAASTRWREEADNLRLENARLVASLQECQERLGRVREALK